MTAKTDNHDPRAKLELRRYFLRKYHADEPPDVLDCCQGGGLLWRKLREEFRVRSYWGVDLKPKKGRLKLDSVRILQQAGWPQNVVDVDTYGSPWKHWAAMLPNITQPTTVFMTMAWVVASFQQYDRVAMQAMKMPANIQKKAPKSILAAMTRFATPWLLCMGTEVSITVIEAVEAESTGNARYIGVRLEPQTATAGVVTRPQPQHPIAVKEQSHV